MSPGFYVVITFIIIIVLGIVISVVSAKKRNARGQNIASAKDSLIQTGFCVSKQVTDAGNNRSLLVDDTNQEWAVIIARSGWTAVFDYSDLIAYEIVEDGDVIVQGRVGSAIVGGILFGGLGAIAGASRSKKVKKTCSSMYVKIVVNSLKTPQIHIPLITSETETNSYNYSIATKKAQEFAAVLSIIKSRAEQEKEPAASASEEKTAQTDFSDQIEKYYSLMERGIITKDEFEQKKKQLLGL